MLRAPPLQQPRKFAPKVPTPSKRAAAEEARSFLRPTEETSDPMEAPGSAVALVPAPPSAAQEVPGDEPAATSPAAGVDQVQEVVQEVAAERAGSGRAGRSDEPGAEPARRATRSQKFSIAGEASRRPGRGSRATRRGPRGADPDSSPVLPSVFGTQDYRISTVYLRRTEEVSAVTAPYTRRP